MSEQGTAVTTTAQEHPEVQALKAAGALAVERQRALNATTKQLAGMKFGEVSGGTLSPETRYAIAQLCQLTGANAGLHLYILGGRPYLNADYWAQVVARQPTLIEYEQIELSPQHSATLRKLAAEAEADASAETDESAIAELREEARAHRRAARGIDRARSHYGIPDNALAAYETVIRRYAEHAPLAAIRTGQVDGGAFVQEVREANWVAAKGQRRDPVGEARPHETARTRSLRRAARAAFSTTLAPMEDELRKLENAIEAEFEVIGTERAEQRASLPAEGERLALRVGAGEPVAAKVEAAKAEVGTRTRDKKQAEPQQQERQPSEAEQRFIDGCTALGIEDREGFAQDALGRLPLDDEDFRTLSAELARIADA